MIEVDPSFRTAGKHARARRRKRRLLAVVSFVFLPSILVLGALWLWTDLPQRGMDRFADWRMGGDEFAMVQVESDLVVAPVVQVNAFIDIAGDPTILRFADDQEGAKQRLREMSGPGVLDIRRVGLPRPDRLVLLQDDLVVQERRLMTALPSTREDFAFFQAQRNRSFMAMQDALAEPQLAALSQLETEVDLGDLSNSYGKSLESGAGAPDGIAAEPKVANNTSVSYLRRETERRPLYRDTVVAIEVPRMLEEVLASNGLSTVDAKRANDEALRMIPVTAELPKGAVVALRVASGEQGGRLLQMSIYSPTSYIGSVAQVRRGEFLPASDPWINDRLLELANATDAEEETDNQGEYRLMDAIYSASIRNGVPTGLVGEVISLMSKSHDLERIAKSGDRITLAYAKEHGPNGQAEGQILFAGVDGPSGKSLCYVVPDKKEGGFRCHVPGAMSASANPGSGFFTPVSGVMTSKFGPRMHPIHKVARLHAGVDWAAPTGTPVYAVAAGRVSHAGDGKGYGNLVILTHPGGLETRYAHLNKFGPAAKKGNLVKSGDLIGYVGTTGRSTGPHLHFETRQNGKPVDPIPLLAGGQVVVASGAVEALVNKIIKVESAGNARAKNSRSTATGLGQFIESTWLRMMRSYRPDLASTMSRADLLNLRFDPTLSREMVKRLAQENERYLRSKGHGITAGWLYLAHFLGPEGAHKVLSANDSLTIAALMGAGVVKANPFLRNYTVADLKAWSTRKMRGRGKGAVVVASAPRPEPVEPEVKLFVDIIDEVLKEAG